MNKNLIAVAIAAVLAGVYVFVLAPLSEKRLELRQTLESEYMTYLRYDRYITGSKEAATRLDDAEKALEVLEKNIQENSGVSVGFAKLQLTVQDLAGRAGLTTLSVKPLPAEEYDHYVGLPIYLDSTGGIKQLSKFLKLLDADDVMLRVDRLDVTGLKDGKLRVKMQLSGLMKT